MEDLASRPLKTSDFKMLKRLWPLVRPIRGLLFLAAFFIVASSLAGLSLPFLTKMAIDRYIVPVGHLITIKDGFYKGPGFKISHSPYFIDSGDGQVFFLKPEGDGLLDQADKAFLMKTKMMSPGKFYMFQFGQDQEHDRQVRQLARDNQDIMTVYPGFAVVAEKDLPRIAHESALMMRSNDLAGLKRLAVFFAVLMALGYLFELGQRVILEIGSQKMGHALRRELMTHLFTLGQSFFDRQETGRLTSRLTSDVNNLNALIKSTATTFFSDLFSLAGITAILFYLSPKLAFITLALTPVLIWLSSYFGKLSRRVQRDLRGKLAAINQYFSETMGGIVVIQAFRRESANSRLFNDLNHDNYLTGLNQLKIQALFLPLVDLFASLILALVIWFGGGAVLDNTISLGVVAAFVGYARRFFLPVQDLAEKLNIFQSAFASLERLIALLDVDEKIPAPVKPVLPPAAKGEIELKNISFKYSETAPWALKGVSFKVNPGESVALVGSTGSGKSSIINLMLRFYDPQAGQILFDGLDLKDLDIKAHTSRIGLVTQDVYLYSATVMENLRLGRISLTDEEIKAAAKAVGADDFIQKLPGGYDEPLGPGGRALSGGQRQLLACARALIEAPEIVILDEATASVDSETELLIDEALKTLFKGRTSVVIAHRLSTIRRADRIFVLSHGKVVEEGTHGELVNRGGYYHRLAALQNMV